MNKIVFFLHASFSVNLVLKESEKENVDPDIKATKLKERVEILLVQILHFIS